MLTNILDYKDGEEVSLPGWGNEDVVFKLKRPSILSLAAKGSIPNALMGVACKLFNSDGKVFTEGKFEDLAKTLTIIAKESLVSPTFKDIEDAGLCLTDDMLTCIYMYVTKGATRLATFRGLVGNLGSDSNGEGVPDKAE